MTLRNSMDDGSDHIVSTCGSDNVSGAYNFRLGGHEPSNQKFEPSRLSSDLSSKQSLFIRTRPLQTAQAHTR